MRFVWANEGGTTGIPSLLGWDFLIVEIARKERIAI